MTKIIPLILLIASVAVGCQSHSKSQSTAQQQVSHVVDSWHKAASDANLDTFFGYLDSDAVYLGTDPQERWSREEFYLFCKPYFEKGKAWDFKPFDRKIYFSQDNRTAWFNELLHTWMGVCRGSGVVVYKDKKWKIKHYHLSVTVKNENIKQFINIEKNSIMP